MRKDPKGGKYEYCIMVEHTVRKPEGTRSYQEFVPITMDLSDEVDNPYEVTEQTALRELAWHNQTIDERGWREGDHVAQAHIERRLIPFFEPWAPDTTD